MKSLNILLVEDNDGDILLISETLNEGGEIGRIDVVRDGKAAIDYFSSFDTTEDPIHLVLLDLNLPKMNGLDVLKFIKSNKNLKHLPVIILTTSSSHKDILQSYQNYANCYLVKPYDANVFAEVINMLKYLWLHIASIPKIR